MKGREMLLMRLSDAVGEARAVDGLQVHRAHWVARDQVRAASRIGDKAVLHMKGRRDILVSRTYVRAIRKAGLLP